MDGLVERRGPVSDGLFGPGGVAVAGWVGAGAVGRSRSSSGLTSERLEWDVVFGILKNEYNVEICRLRLQNASLIFVFG